eukprot:CAMPEP_0176472330 /NCGR_PEP_ID=MMETSP0127-20121128/41685_1 /TAXON_ID=938130 /ORGANISM="Platyophrya macrostoma, Strain WH" /LENGTH=423 /DNA_ID=CAMNT_0017867191 /DNA_START=22 /DNA_END=1293 /DNA_ORIENTATION=-
MTTTQTTKKVKHYTFNVEETPISKCKFGGVYVGRDTKENRDVIINVIPFTRVKRNFSTEIFQRKVDYLKSIRGPNVVQLLDIIIATESGHIYVVSESFHKRELGHLLNLSKGVPESHALRLLRHVICALRLNRDLATRYAGYEYNYLLEAHKHLTLYHLYIAGGRVKVGDTGLFNLLEETVEMKEYPDSKETNLYEAPEVTHRKEQALFDISDVWSLGVILYHCLFDASAFKGHTVEERYDRLERDGLQFPEDVLISENCKDLLRRMIVLNPKSRITMSEVLTHPAMREALVLRKDGERRSFRETEVNLLTALENTFNEVEDALFLYPHSKPAHDKALDRPILYDEYQPQQEVEEPYREQYVRPTEPEQIQVQDEKTRQPEQVNVQVEQGETQAQKEERERREKEQQQQNRREVKASCKCNIF